MSMNDTEIELRNFKRALGEFNSQLKESIKELKSKHDFVSPLWQDEMRKTYDSAWDPLEQSMKNYNEREAPAYERFLDEKIRTLGRYLRGN